MAEQVLKVAAAVDIALKRGEAVPQGDAVFPGQGAFLCCVGLQRAPV